MPMSRESRWALVAVRYAFSAGSGKGCMCAGSRLEHCISGRTLLETCTLWRQTTVPAALIKVGLTSRLSADLSVARGVQKNAVHAALTGGAVTGVGDSRAVNCSSCPRRRVCFFRSNRRAFSRTEWLSQDFHHFLL